MEQALQYTVDLCDGKEACQLLMAGCEIPLSTTAESMCHDKPGKLIAAPGLGEQEYGLFKRLCADRGIGLINSGLRGHLAGIDIGFTVADYGIAETGTLVLDST
ncbi:MAG: lactate utilization protein, partial [Desulfobulbaceae bacterium A2]